MNPNTSYVIGGWDKNCKVKKKKRVNPFVQKTVRYLLWWGYFPFIGKTSNKKI